VKKALKALVTAVRRHRLFALFFIATLSLNIILVGRMTREATDFFSCSSYDRGPLGSYGIFTYLEEKKAPISRIKLPPFRVLDKAADTGKTLMIISPQYAPGPWEWSQIMEWVKSGNRLITAGVFIPSRFMEYSGYTRPESHDMPRSPVKVALPVDSVFPYGTELPLPPSLPELLVNYSKKKTDSSRVLVQTLSHLQPGMLPLLTCESEVLAAKLIVGRGEWVMFAYYNPFANVVLKKKQWFEFACRLINGDGRYAFGKIMFDEYHNGYRATKSFWQMLKYYEFDSAILLGSALILLYLFFTGIRVLPPLDRLPPPSRDVVPGLRSMANLFFRYRAFEGLVKRELTLLRRHLLGAEESPDARFLVQAYLGRAPLPKGFAGAEQLENLLRRADKEFPSLTRTEIITLFNTITTMRKELSL
jgi:hypothetical protein